MTSLLSETVRRFIQVKTTKLGQSPKWPKATTVYHAVALVQLLGRGDAFLLDESRIYLIPKAAARGSHSWTALAQFLLSPEQVDSIFSEL
jgi:hypothetical protein